MNDKTTTYVEGIHQLLSEAEGLESKSQALEKLTSALMCTKEPPPRLAALQAFEQIKNLKSVTAKIEKRLNSSKAMLTNVILDMLEVEQLDNFSHDGKLFYPSTTTRFSVKDRTELIEFILSQDVQSAIEILGNTLNSDFIKNYMETNSIIDTDTGELIPSVPPKGVALYTSTTLNMRKK